MRVLFALSGLHRVDRGAEISFIAVARQLANEGASVTLIGSGNERPGAPYRFIHSPCLPRERFETFPTLPVLRNEYAYEELTFVPGLLARYRPTDYDVTLTCGYPFTNWVLRRPALGSRRPAHVFVTQNGDWPAHAADSEYRFFGCEGLVCINPDAYARNKERWRSALIPNGVDRDRFTPGPGQRREFGLPENTLVVLMVSALIPSKRVQLGMQTVSQIAGAHLVVAGDGPERDEVTALAARLLPGRFTHISVTPDKMPALYRSANVFLHLSRDESFGNVFIEAMACGLPIVGIDTPRLRWIIGEDEFLVTDDSAGELAVQIRLAAAEPPQRSTGRARKADAFSWTRVAGMYRDFLEEILANNSEPRQ